MKTASIFLVISGSFLARVQSDHPPPEPINLDGEYEYKTGDSEAILSIESKACDRLHYCWKINAHVCNFLETDVRMMVGNSWGMKSGDFSSTKKGCEEPTDKLEQKIKSLLKGIKFMMKNDHDNNTYLTIWSSHGIMEFKEKKSKKPQNHKPKPETYETKPKIYKTKSKVESI